MDAAIAVLDRLRGRIIEWCLAFVLVYIALASARGMWREISDIALTDAAKKARCETWVSEGLYDKWRWSEPLGCLVYLEADGYGWRTKN